jgi:2-polyprenyl-3-methyl-5-hydroxy-6-metoxy-1,4-benzoquinol methylase
MRSVIAGWDAAAQYYAAWIDGGCGAEGNAFTTIVTTPIPEAISQVAGKSVLALGCEEGYLARERLQRSARVAGIDCSAAMIAIAESKNAASGS